MTLLEHLYCNKNCTSTLLVYELKIWVVTYTIYIICVCIVEVLGLI